MSSRMSNKSEKDNCDNLNSTISLISESSKVNFGIPQMKDLHSSNFSS